MLQLLAYDVRGHARVNYTNQCWEVRCQTSL